MDGGNSGVYTGAAAPRQDPAVVPVAWTPGAIPLPVLCLDLALQPPIHLMTSWLALCWSPFVLNLAKIFSCPFHPKKPNCYTEIQDFFSTVAILHIWLLVLTCWVYYYMRYYLQNVNFIPNPQISAITRQSISIIINLFIAHLVSKGFHCVKLSYIGTSKKKYI